MITCITIEGFTTIPNGFKVCHSTPMCIALCNILIIYVHSTFPRMSRVQYIFVFINILYQLIHVVSLDMTSNALPMRLKTRNHVSAYF